MYYLGKICGRNHMCGGNFETAVGSKKGRPRFVHVIARPFFAPAAVSKFPPHTPSVPKKPSLVLDGMFSSTLNLDNPI